MIHLFKSSLKLSESDIVMHNQKMHILAKVGALNIFKASSKVQFYHQEMQKKITIHN